jgi:hypothetical protein
LVGTPAKHPAAEVAAKPSFEKLLIKRKTRTAQQKRC